MKSKGSCNFTEQTRNIFWQQSAKWEDHLCSKYVKKCMSLPYFWTEICYHIAVIENRKIRVSKVLFSACAIRKSKIINHILLLKSFWPKYMYTQLFPVAKLAITSVTEPIVSATKMQSTYLHTFSFKSLPETIHCMHWTINLNRLSLVSSCCKKKPEFALSLLSD